MHNMESQKMVQTRPICGPGIEMQAVENGLAGWEGRRGAGRIEIGIDVYTSIWKRVGADCMSPGSSAQCSVMVLRGGMGVGGREVKKERIYSHCCTAETNTTL